MSTAMQCPDRESMRQLYFSAATPQEIAGLVAHLEQCPRCGEQFDELSTNDDLARLLSAPPVLGSTPAPASEALDRLRQRLSLLRPVPASDNTWNMRPPDSVSDAAEPPPAVDDHTEVGFTFLTPPQQPDEIGRLGAYRVLKKLGSGGMGMVFLAEDPMLKRQIALKTLLPRVALNPESRQRFLREARAAAALDHPHIIAIHQVGEDHGVLFVAMPLLRGESLEDRLRRDTRLSPAEAARVAVEIADGLAAAHAAGLIHRDIKPGNIWLENQSGRDPTDATPYQALPRVKLLDFGLARSQSEDQRLTHSGMIVGTPAYMAPEQVDGKAVDARADLFSLGCVLYRMLTGKLPFEGESLMNLLASIFKHTPPPPHEVNPAVSAEFGRLTMRLLGKTPGDRPASAAEVREQLRRLRPEADDPTLVTRVPAPAPVRHPPHRRGLLAVAAALLILLPLGYFYGATILRIVTNKGELVIESDDPNVEVTVKGPNVTVYDKVKDRRFVLSPGDYDIEVREEGDGGVRFATKRVTITRGGKETFVARLELAKAKTPDTDTTPVRAGDERKAAEWVLSLGGKVTVRDGDGEREVSTAKELPAEPQVVRVDLNHRDGVTDADLARLRPMSRLSWLKLDGTPVTDAGLAHLKGMTSLTALDLGDTKVSNAGLEQLKGLTGLTLLLLNGTSVSGAGLQHLQTLPRLTNLGLARTPIGDTGLQKIEPLTNLAILDLGVTTVSDAGMAHLKPLTALERLNLYDTKVTDAGMAHLKVLPRLVSADVRSTKVTNAGVAALRQALPACTVFTDDSAIADERSAAEWVLSFGGTLDIEEGENRRTVAAAKDLPDRPFRVVKVVLIERGLSDDALKKLQPLSNVTELVLSGSTVTDAGLVHLKPLTRLTRLSLDHTQVRGPGLAHLQTLTKLQFLGLDYAPMRDDAVAPLAKLTGLTELSLNGTFTGDGVMAYLKSLTNLTYLNLNRTGVTDAGMEHVRWLPNLKILQLAGTKVTDAGMAHLKVLPRLVSADLSDTKVTAAAVAALRQALPACNVITEGSAVRDERRAAEWVLAAGGSLDIEEGENRRTVAAAKDLPAGPFRVTKVELRVQAVTDADLEKLRPLTSLTELVLAGTQVSDDGLAYLKPLTNLTRLKLHYTRVRGPGLAHLQTLPKLQFLDLDGAPVTDAGAASLAKLKTVTQLSLCKTETGDAALVHLKGNTNLTHLYLNGTGVTDAGLLHLQTLTGLCGVQVGSTKVTDAGLANLKTLTNLNELYLTGTKVTDAGLKHLEAFPQLLYLYLEGTAVSDAGLEQLKKLTSLNSIDLTGTRATAAGVEALRKALPKCKIDGP
jgi:serine/threonine protein kinase/Leucine-rich repeat (LRR) protein